MKAFQTKTLNRIDFFFWAGLAAVLTFAFLARAYRADWGLPYLYHWDEPQTASAALRMLKTGNFNPYFYNYGTLPIYLNYFVDIFHYLYLMGQPETALAYLNELADIKTYFDTKWIWTISHPTFYYWNRILSVAFGVGSVCMTYLIGHVLLGNRWLALAAAFFMASIPIHIEYSALITTDVPVCFFVLVATFFSLRFVNEGQTKYLSIALIFVGFAMATKYNASLVMLLPCVACLLQYVKNRQAFKRMWLLMLPIIPMVTFFICMPYALIDSANFLAGLGWELRHYKVLGHDPHTSIPGIRHIKFQIHTVIENIGLFAVVIAAVGMVSAIKTPKLLFIISLPVVYFLYMTTMKVNFHRNFIVLYPFIAILYSAAIGGLYEIGQKLILKINGDIQKIKLQSQVVPLLIPLLLVGYLGFLASTAWQKSVTVKNSADPRSQLIRQINAVQSVTTVYVPIELRVHAQDLRQLIYPFKLISLSDIYACKDIAAGSLAMIPATLEAGYEATGDEKKLAEHYPAMFASFSTKKARLESGSLVTKLDKFSIDPKILVFDRDAIGACSNAASN
jgi:4-amino-4-deoxy-L-arabinose transferase-like glycosyltransferase